MIAKITWAENSAEQKKRVKGLKFPKPNAKARKLKIRGYRPLRKAAWKNFSRLIRVEEKLCYTCEKYCSREGQPLELGHFIHRDSLDFVREGLHSQGTSCNRWKHGNHAIYAIRLVEQYGPEILGKLERISHARIKYDREDLERIANTTMLNEIKDITNVDRIIKKYQVV